MSRLALIATLLVSASVTAQGFCPCYTPSVSPSSNCATEAAQGTNPTVADWQDIFAKAAGGAAAWGTGGPTIGTLGQGCGHPTPSVQVPARFPCEVIKAIAMQESGWKHFCRPSTPSGAAGLSSRTIISFDCGYGIGQVTSGMRTFDATPTYDRQRVVSEPLYNLATGMRILAEKWRITNCIGDNQPTLVEHWYSATWAYNGLSSKNSPNNPSYNTTRGVYQPGVSSSTRPYQEIVWGWMEYPPSAAHYAVTRPAYPKLSDIGGGSSPQTLPDPTCASPTSCATTRPLHTSACFGGTDGGTGGGSAGTGGGAAGGGMAGAGGGSAGGGASGVGGGSSATGGGTAATGGGNSAPATYPLATDELGAASTQPLEKQCGCGAGPGGLLFALVIVLRRKPLAR